MLNLTRRIFTAVLAVILLTTLFACSTTDPAQTSPSPSPTAVFTSPKPSPSPLPPVDIRVLDEVTIRIPGCYADFVLRDVYSFYSRSDWDNPNQASYKFYFAEGKGSITCDKAADFFISPDFWFNADGSAAYDKMMENFELGKTSMILDAGWTFEIPDEWLEWDGKIQSFANVDTAFNRPDYTVPYSSGGKATFVFSVGDDYNYDTTTGTTNNKRPLEDLMITEDSPPAPVQNPLPVLDTATIRLPGFDTDITLTDALDSYTYTAFTTDPTSPIQDIGGMYRVFFAEGRGSIAIGADTSCSWHAFFYDEAGFPVDGADYGFTTDYQELSEGSFIFTIPEEFYSWEGKVYIEGACGTAGRANDYTVPKSSRGQLHFTFNIGDGDFAYGVLRPLEEITTN